MIHHDRSPYLYHWFNHLTSLAFHIAFGTYLHVEIVRSQRSWKVDVLAWSFVLLACVIAVISSWAKPWCGMTWYLLVYTISYQHTEKEALDCSTTGISVKCKSSRANFNVGAYTCAALHYSHQCKSLYDLVPLMSCSLLQCSITNSCSSLRSFSPHSHEITAMHC